MKKIYYIFISIILVGCYSDESEIVTSENIAHHASEITALLKSMSSHNGSFDDTVDNTSCFSLDFPYQIYVNSDLRTISTLDDVLELNNDDNIEIVYPVSTNFFNYEEHQVVNQTEFNLVKNTCEQDFNMLANHCLNIEYPISIKIFNDLTESFESIEFNNNKEVYLQLDNLHDNDLYEIDYPVFLTTLSSETIRVDNNQEFTEVYYTTEQNCD